MQRITIEPDGGLDEADRATVRGNGIVVDIIAGSDGQLYIEVYAAAALQGSDALREYVEEYLGESPGGLAGDLLTGALAWVDWDEIAQARHDDAMRDLVREAADADPGETDEPPLCPCGHGYVGHGGHD
jgi:hypothetical protein